MKTNPFISENKIFGTKPENLWSLLIINFDS